MQRCAWALHTSDEMSYHDTEWGMPLHDDQKLFEFLCLEGAQAGLSWRTILAKRSAYRALFHDFSIDTVAAMTDQELHVILQNPGIVRNCLKVYSVRRNAQAVQQLISKHGSLRAFLWSFTGHTPQQPNYQQERDIPTTNDNATQMSKELKRAGCSFVGPTISYAFMQATGMTNDHIITCFRHKEVQL